MGIAIVTTTKEDPRTVRRFVQYHLNLGIDRIVLFLDDASEDYLGLSSENVHIILCNETYWKNRAVDRSATNIPIRQRVNLNYIAPLLRQEGFRYLISIDIDELIHTPHCEFRYLVDEAFGGDQTIDAIRMEEYEAYPRRIHYDCIYEPTLFKRNVSQDTFLYAEMAGCRRAIYHNRFFRAHIHSKSIARLSDTIDMYDIHWPRRKEGECRFLRSTSIKMLHFDCIGVENFTQKWEYRYVNG